MRDNSLSAAKGILIVDDEALARQRVRRYLERSDASFEISEAENGLQAVELLRKYRFDVVFLDIEMPELNGFEVLAQFDERPFQVVFQTAYDEFAVRAFEEHAADYLLKPFTFDRFRDALSRVLSRAADEERLQKLETEMRKRDGFLKRLTVRQGGRLRIVDESEIVCFVSRDHYTCVYFADAREAICDLSLSHLVARLDQQRFRQLHRSNIACMSAIRSLAFSRAEGMTVELINGMKLPVSRGNRRMVRQLVSEASSLEQ